MKRSKSETSATEADDIVIVESSGNVFDDLDVHLDPKDELKVAIAYQICKLINDKGLTQQQAAKILKTDQAKISAVTRGRLTGFSVDRLLNFVTALGYDVDVSLKPSKEPQGKVTVYPSLVTS